jgi:hypothetical protein
MKRRTGGISYQHWKVCQPCSDRKRKEEGLTSHCHIQTETLPCKQHTQANTLGAYPKSSSSLQQFLLKATMRLEGGEPCIPSHQALSMNFYLNTQPCQPSSTNSNSHIACYELSSRNGLAIKKIQGDIEATCSSTNHTSSLQPGYRTETGFLVPMARRSMWGSRPVDLLRVRTVLHVRYKSGS